MRIDHASSFVGGARHPVEQEEPAPRRCERLVDLAVDRNDAAERARCIGLAGADICRRAIAIDGDAARVVVLDDDRGGLGELEAQAERGVEIEDVVVRQLLAAEHLGPGDRRPRDARGRELPDTLGMQWRRLYELR